MVYKRPKKIKQVTIIPHTYRGINSGMKDVPCFVIKGDEHPDPSKMLTWGLWADGTDMPGDYNGFFRRNGRPINLDIDITECWTASQEKQAELEGVRKYISALHVSNA